MKKIIIAISLIFVLLLLASCVQQSGRAFGPSQKSISDYMATMQQQAQIQQQYQQQAQVQYPPTEPLPEQQISAPIMAQAEVQASADVKVSLPLKSPDEWVPPELPIETIYTESRDNDRTDTSGSFPENDGPVIVTSNYTSKRVNDTTNVSSKLLIGVTGAKIVSINITETFEGISSQTNMRAVAMALEKAAQYLSTKASSEYTKTRTDAQSGGKNQSSSTTTTDKFNMYSAAVIYKYTVVAAYPPGTIMPNGQKSQGWTKKVKVEFGKIEGT